MSCTSRVRQGGGLQVWWGALKARGLQRHGELAGCNTVAGQGQGAPCSAQPHNYHVNCWAHVSWHAQCNAPSPAGGAAALETRPAVVPSPLAPALPNELPPPAPALAPGGLGPWETGMIETTGLCPVVALAGFRRQAGLKVALVLAAFGGEGEGAGEPGKPGTYSDKKTGRPFSVAAGSLLAETCSGPGSLGL